MSHDHEEHVRARDLPLETVAELPEKADVVVVGGGIAGTSVLHHLAGAGIDALLLERERVGGGATSVAVGVLSPPLRQPFHETARDRGEDTARAVWGFAQRSVAGLADALRALGAEREAELDLGGGHVLAEPFTLHEVESSYQALAQAGFPVRWIDGEEVRAHTGGRGFVGGFRIEGGGSLNPAGTARLLARGAVAAGARVAEGTRVDEVEHAGGGLVCRTPAGSVRCDTVVYAVHVDAKRFAPALADEIVPIRGQALAARIVKGSLPEGCWTTHWKLNAWRRSGAGRLHLGGWRHEAWDRSYSRTRPEVDRTVQESLEAWFRQAFPAVEIEVTSHWSGIFGWTADYLPLVGALPGAGDELVVSGFSGGGLPFAFECGRVAVDLLRGRDPGEGAALLAPSRLLS
jgi:glycine/D-amino acid oxidase-like deaminating enzyme